KQTASNGNEFTRKRKTRCHKVYVSREMCVAIARYSPAARSICHMRENRPPCVYTEHSQQNLICRHRFILAQLWIFNNRSFTWSVISAFCTACSLSYSLALWLPPAF